MKWPFVSRARLELLEHNFAKLREEKHEADRRAENWYIESTQNAALIDGWGHRYDALLEKYDSLAKLMVGAPAAPAAPIIDEPVDELPPQVVLDAMRTISPIRDKTYDANWAFWELNRERAAKYPEDFAAEILEGFTEPAIQPD